MQVYPGMLSGIHLFIIINMSQLSINLTAATDVGRVRKNNEDNFILNKDLSQSDWFLPEKDAQPIDLGPVGCLLAVADGMGGLNAGEVASDIAITTVKSLFSTTNLDKIVNSDRSIEKFMRKCVVSADEAIKNRVESDPSTSGMGTTLVLAWICGTKAYIVWCGDSRGYIFNPVSGLRRITKDHSYVQQLVDDGKLSPDLAFDHPDSNIITRCLGDFKGSAKPDFNSIDLEVGDHILICSDGLCGLCRDDEIEQIFRQYYGNMEMCKNEFISHAMEAGGYDNCTLALCEIESIDGNTYQKTNTNKLLSSTLNEYVKNKDIPEEKVTEEITEQEQNEQAESDTCTDSETKDTDNDSTDSTDGDKLRKLTQFPYVEKKKVSIPRGVAVFLALLVIALVILLIKQYIGQK